MLTTLAYGDYLHVRREFWQQTAISALASLLSDKNRWADSEHTAAASADKLLVEWDKRFGVEINVPTPPGGNG